MVNIEVSDNVVTLEYNSVSTIIPSLVNVIRYIPEEDRDSISSITIESDTIIDWKSNYLSGFNLSELYIDGGTLHNLQYLPDVSYISLVNVGLTKFPNELIEDTRRELLNLDISNNKIDILRIPNYNDKLVHLDISHNMISNISSICNLRSLLYLNASNNTIHSVNIDLGKIVSLDLSHNCLEDLKELRSNDTISILDISHNRLKCIYYAHRLSALITLNSSNNMIDSIYELDMMVNQTLTSINLAHNLISRIPRICIDNGLELDLSHNRLTHRGFYDEDSMGGIDFEVDSIDAYDSQDIRLIVIGNDIQEFPEYLLLKYDYHDILLFMKLDYNIDVHRQVEALARHRDDRNIDVSVKDDVITIISMH